MGIAVGNILPLAVGVALSHGPILAVILLLAPPHTRRTSLAFVLGWLLGLTLVGGVALMIASSQHLSDVTKPHPIAALIKLLLGAFLLFLAGWQWKHHSSSEVAKLPRALAALDAFTPIKAFLLGTIFAGASPKNFSLTVSAVLEIARVDLPVTQTMSALVIFVCLASVTIVVPVVLALATGARAAEVLARWKAWLVANHQAVQFVVLLVMGSLLIGKSIRELAGG
jgi:hypothetical protein